MARGATAAEAVAILTRTGAAQRIPPGPRRRRRWTARAIHSGAERARHLGGGARRTNVACGGNLLADDGVPAGHGRRLRWRRPAISATACIAAMRAALDAGGEAGPVHSAGLKLVREVAWPVADLRVDWTED